MCKLNEFIKVKRESVIFDLKAMDKRRSLTKKQRKIFGPFVKDERMLQRLKSYVGEKAFKANESEIRSTLNGESKRKKRKKMSSYRLDMLDLAADNYEELSSTDSLASLDDNSDKTDSNVLNKSLRNVYSNSRRLGTVSLDAKDTDGETNSHRLMLTPCVNENKLDNSSCLENTQKSKTANDIKNESFSARKAKAKKTPSIPIQQPSTKFSDIGGLDDTLAEICKLFRHLKRPDVSKIFGRKNPTHGFLLHGPSGCGKTLIAHAIAGELELPFIEIAATDLVSGVSGESESKIRDLFESAVSCAPSILFIDEIDAITPKRETVQSGMEKRIVAQLLTCMDELGKKNSGAPVMVIGATNRPHALDPALRRGGRFDREISIGIPNEAARLQILKVVCSDIKFSPDFKLEWLARNTPGYIGSDLMAITTAAVDIAIDRTSLNILYENTTLEKVSPAETTEKVPLSLEISWLKDKSLLNEEQLKDFYVETRDFEAALQIYVPSSKREGFATIPNVTWDDVGALKSVQSVLQTAILWPIKYQKEFKDFHLKSLTGVLLCGPKGCGKTLLAKAVANECSINFLSVKGPELLSMYVGESERAVRECFQRARNSAPCVIFFDEIDALCPSRTGSNENPAAERVVNQLLTEIDGVEGRKNIFIMGATNRPENIDSAMLRPGRFEKVLFIGVPAQEDRLDILRKITKNGTQPKIADCVDLEYISKDARCCGFSGADLTSLVREASSIAFEDYINLQVSSNVPQNFEIKLCHFEKAFANVKPSITDKDQHFFKKEDIKELFKAGKSEIRSKNNVSKRKKLSSNRFKMELADMLNSVADNYEELSASDSEVGLSLDNSNSKSDSNVVNNSLRNVCSTRSETAYLGPKNTDSETSSRQLMSTPRVNESKLNNSLSSKATQTSKKANVKKQTIQ